jgi:hypothetical protein
MTRGVGGHGPANIMKHLKGMHFPASKDDILNHARSGAGPDTGAVMDVLEQIDNRQYDSPAGIMHEVGKIE